MKIKLKTNKSSYYTHQPILGELARTSTGPILELGCGYGSTELLHHICARTPQRKLVTIEQEPQWLNQFKHFEQPWHVLRLVDKWDDSFFKDYAAPTWGIVFVDQGLWENRVDAVTFFKDKADYLVLHDSDWFASHNTPHAQEVDGKNVYNFKYWKEFTPPKGGPPTAVVSQGHPVEIEIDWNWTEIEI